MPGGENTAPHNTQEIANGTVSKNERKLTSAQTKKIKKKNKALRSAHNLLPLLLKVNLPHTAQGSP